MRSSIKLNVYTCTRCGYQWVQSPRATDRPKNCASKKCKSPYWDRPRVRGDNVPVRK